MKTWNSSTATPEDAEVMRELLASTRRTSTASATRRTTSTSSTASATSKPRWSTGSKAARAWSSSSRDLRVDRDRPGSAAALHAEDVPARQPPARDGKMPMSAAKLRVRHRGRRVRPNVRSWSPRTSTAARSATIASSVRSSRSRRACASARAADPVACLHLRTGRRSARIASSAHGVMFINDLFAIGGPAQGDAHCGRPRESAIASRSAPTRRSCRSRICDDVVIGAGRGCDPRYQRARHLRGQSCAPASRLRSGRT